MADAADTRDALRTVARVLMWCILLSGAILVLWFGMLVLAGEWVYRMHAQFFPVSREHFAFLHYGGLALLKSAVIVLFLVPYAAIRIVLRRDRH
jgi:hypothetical protein